MKILVDQREKLPYSFSGENTEEVLLDVGDYTYEGFQTKFAVERKTLDDLASSLGSDRERFEAEVERAQDLEAFAVVIEAPERAVSDYEHQKKCPNYFSRIYPASIMGTVRQWPEKYDVLDFVWADNREGGKQETLRLLDQWYLEFGSDLF